jgi:hypothetical protein
MFSECAVEAWLSPGRKRGLISLITGKLWSFFATLGHPVFSSIAMVDVAFFYNWTWNTSNPRS